MKEQLTLDETVEMLRHVCDGMIASEPVLTDADRAIGDGDHGLGMQRGFKAAREKLDAGGFETIDKVFSGIGMALISSMGGASGAIFGTFFRNGGKAIAGCAAFGGAELASFLETGLEGVKSRGGAKGGDKTVIDALEPAAASAKGKPALSEAVEAAADAAEEGKEKTRDMVATTGKARTLGERSLGHPDPGAISATLILRFMGEYLDDERL